MQRLLRRRFRGRGGARPVVRRMATSGALALRESARHNVASKTDLTIGGVHDPAETQADAMADHVMRMPAGDSVVHRKCDTCEAEDNTVRRASEGGGGGAGATVASPSAAKAVAALGQGAPLAPAERAFFEPRFDADLSGVRVHEGNAADRAANAVHARAFTLGSDIALAAGETRGGEAGRRLMAHELAHVVQERGEQIRRAPKDDGGIAKDAAQAESELLDAARAFKANDGDSERAVIVAMKYLRRVVVEPKAQSVILEKADAILGKETSAALWAKSALAFAGYTGIYPSYAPNIGTHFKTLGVEKPMTFGAFERTAPGDAAYRAAAERAAAKAEPSLRDSDIVFFRGHQYAQHAVPALFSNVGRDQHFIDLRYLGGAEDFKRVKLFIATSCATLCNDTLDVFTSLFPNAAILGYAGSAPIDGDAVQSAFVKAIAKANVPLILSEVGDIGQVVSIWQRVIQSTYTNEETAQRRKPGFYQNGQVTYWNGKAWLMAAHGDKAINCKISVNESAAAPGPRRR